jgi:hypothetical protein
MPEPISQALEKKWSGREDLNLRPPGPARHPRKALEKKPRVCPVIAGESLRQFIRVPVRRHEPCV